jgi:hypothetical protein
MTPQERIDGRRLVVTQLAGDRARHRFHHAVVRLARAREARRDADWILACSRGVHVAQQQHLEAQEDPARAHRAVNGAASISWAKPQVE